MNLYYLDDFLLEQRSEHLEAEIKKVDPSVELNRDFHPYMFIKHTEYWLSHFGTSYTLLVAIPLVLSLIFLFSLDPVSLGLYTGGFSAASLRITSYNVCYTKLLRYCCRQRGNGKYPHL